MSVDEERVKWRERDNEEERKTAIVEETKEIDGEEERERES